MLDVSTAYMSPIPDVKPLPAPLKPPAPPINGQGRPAFERLTKSQRAALGVAVMRGEASLLPTLKVVAGALGVSVTYLEAAMKLAPQELRQLECGELTLAEEKSAEAPKSPTSLTDVVAWWLTASEAERAAVVGIVGIGSAWDAIEAHLD
jgi:hypothetical protein